MCSVRAVYMYEYVYDYVTYFVFANIKYMYVCCLFVYVRVCVPVHNFSCQF